MKRKVLTKFEKAAIDTAITHFIEHRHLFEGIASGLLELLQTNNELNPFIHFIKYRVKSEGRLRKKLVDKILSSSRGTKPVITAENLFTEINDLAGVRIIHLHTNQLEDINRLICELLEKEGWKIVDGPIANCWDVEYEEIYKSFNIKSVIRDSLYSSVHYILQINERTKISIELQVRTLMEEVWGEVSHRVGYEETDINALVDQQLKILARLTSGSTRLVDCIFDTYQNK